MDGSCVREYIPHTGNVQFSDVAYVTYAIL